MSKTKQGTNLPDNRAFLLRGGRMTKFKGQVASYAPSLGRIFSGVSAAALGTAVSLVSSPATGGTCVSQSPGSINFVCSGPADPVNDVSVGIISSAPVNVQTMPGFGLEPFNASNAIDLFSQTGVTFVDDNRSSITSATSDALRAVVDFSGDVSVTSNGVLTGGNFGIYSRHYGTFAPGLISISAADVSGARSDGIYARNNNGTGISITASGTVTGARSGIAARSTGSGALSISTADVTGAASYGIIARNYGTDLTIDSRNGTVSGAIGGIVALNNGTGVLTVQAADVTGGGNHGLFAHNFTGTDLSVTASGTVSGGASGIYTLNDGSGALTISTAEVTGTNGSGLYARNQGTNLSITTSGIVSGGRTGIDATNTGSGALNISVDEVTGTSRRGISAFNRGTDLSVTATGTVSGGRDAIYAGNRGSGNVTVDVGDAISTDDGYGINARNYGAGALVISAVNVTGTANNSGLLGINNGTDLSITTSGLVTSNWRGISASNNGTGTLNITAVDVTGTRLEGIRARGFGTDIAITSSGEVSGETRGIYARNYGNGALRISAVNVTGASEDGIFAINDSTGTDLIITTTGTVRGAASGIFAQSFGTGGLHVNVSGAVEGDGGAGIETRTNANGLSVIELQHGAFVSSASGEAITDNEGDSQVILAAGSAVAGLVQLNDGVDALLVDGGADISAATLFDGGAGTQDALTFSAFTGAVDGSRFTNWESLKADNRSSLKLDNMAAGFGVVAVQNGSSVEVVDRDFNLAGALQLDATSSFLASHAGSGDVIVSGDIFNDGQIRLADDQSGDRFTAGGNISGAGFVSLDVDFSAGTNDQINVSGDSAGAQLGLQVQKFGGSDASLRNITLATVSGMSAKSDFQLVGGDFVAKNGQAAINAGAYAFLVDYDAATGAFFLTPFSANGGVNRNPDRAFLAAGVQQFSDHMSLSGALQRLSGRTGGAQGETVSRSLIDLSTTDQPLIWVNAEGGRDSYTFEDRNNETTSGGVRVGASLPLAEMGNGSLIGGLEFGVTTFSTDSETSLADGRIDTDAYDVTLSALWLAGSQLYVDGQLRYAYFDGTTRLAGGQDVESDGEGFATSIEVGKIFTLENGLSLIPQAQLIFSNVDADELRDVTGGATGSVSDGNTLSARLGLRAERELGGAGVFYGQLDYFHALDNETGVTFGNDTVLTERGKNNIALTLGGNMALTEGTTLFGEISAQRGFDGGSDDHGYAGQIGFEFRF